MKRVKMYHSLPISYAQLFPILVQKYKMPIISAKPRKSPYSKWYDLSARCEYHGGVHGHFTESCTPLKDKVQVLIDVDLAKFYELLKGYQG